MNVSRTRISKANDEGSDEKLFRLTEIEPEFVSLVRAGANRQKAFQVVKEDDDNGSVDPPATDDSAPDAPLADTQQGADEMDEQAKTSGDDVDVNVDSDKDATDLASWLDEAGDKVEEMSLDDAITRALDATDGDDSTDASASSKKNEADEIDTTLTPHVDEDGAEGDEPDPRDAKIAELEDTVRRQARELKRATAKAARLAKGVGLTSVMATGEVTSSAGRQADTDESPSRGAFLSGGDIAAAVSGKRRH